MSLLNSWGIRAKLFAGFGAVLVLLALVGAVGWKNTYDFSSAFASLYADRLVPAVQLGKIQQGLYELRLGAAGVSYATADAATREKVRAADAQWLKQVEQNFKDYADTILVPEEQERVKKWQQAYPAFVQVRQQLVDLTEQGRTTEAADLRSGPVAQQLGQLLTLSQELTAIQERVGNSQEQVVSATATSSTRLLAGLLAVALATGSAVAFFLSGSLAARIGAVAVRAEQLRRVAISGLGNASQALARGDLSLTVETDDALLPVTSQDEVGRLAESLNGIVRQTRETVVAFGQATTTLRGVVAQTQELIEAAQEGLLDSRGDATRFEGAYHDLVAGVNAVLDAMSTPLSDATTVLARVADRDLAARATGTYRGEYARLATSLNAAADNLDTALRQVAGGAEQVATAAAQISGGSQALAQGASEQASSLEEVGSSLQEMAATTRQTAGAAREARSLTEGARATVEGGVESMRRLSEAIGRIKGSADDTAKIVKTIDEIAFQTNLLALNAAVEAARAGDAGKGFAVVAEEVRNLAMRSAEAAKSTASLIEESVANADGGVQLNQEVLSKLGEIASQVTQVSGVMGQIASAADEQSQGIAQITTAVEQMNQVTQQTAASAEEAAAAAEELSGQSAEMRQMVAAFSLSAHTGQPLPGSTGHQWPTTTRHRTLTRAHSRPNGLLQHDEPEPHAPAQASGVGDGLRVLQQF